MKKTSKTLKLKKETVRDLTNQQLERAGAGIDWTLGATVCGSSCVQTLCLTCQACPTKQTCVGC